MGTAMNELEKELEREFKHWDTLYHHGSYDPFYADGMGLNLTRNHIIRCKQLMEELAGNQEASLFGSVFPEIYYKETPPEVDYHYMANPEAIRARAKEQISLYEQDESFQYLLSIKDTVFPNNQETKETKEAHLPYFQVLRLQHYNKSYEDDDLVAMRRDFYVDYDRLKEDWVRYAEEIKSFLAREKTAEQICPAEDKKEPLEAKIDRLTANNTTSEPKSSKQKDTKQEKPFQKEEQLFLF